MAEDLDEASNELIVTDEEAVNFSVGECFVMVDNDKAGGGRERAGWPERFREKWQRDKREDPSPPTPNTCDHPSSEASGRVLFSPSLLLEFFSCPQ